MFVCLIDCFFSSWPPSYDSPALRIELKTCCEEYEPEIRSQPLSEWIRKEIYLLFGLKYWAQLEIQRKILVTHF